MVKFYMILIRFKIYLFYYYYFATPRGLWFLVLWPGMEPVPPILKVQESKLLNSHDSNLIFN